MIFNLPREPRPGEDRVRIRASGTAPVYHPVRRLPSSDFGRIAASPEGEVVTWGSYYDHLANSGAIEVLDFDPPEKPQPVEMAPPAPPAEAPPAAPQPEEVNHA